MKINIEVNNKMLNSIMEDAVEQLERICEEEFKSACIDTVRDAKAYCPVDTGRLRKSINAQMEYSDGVWSALIGSDVEYAYWVENGHGTIGKNQNGQSAFNSFIPGNPFLRTAIMRNWEFMKDNLEEKISKALGGSNS